MLCKHVKYYTVHVSPACNALEIRNGIMFDFYPGLPPLAFISNTLNVVHLHFLTTRLSPELQYRYIERVMSRKRKNCFGSCCEGVCVNLRWYSW